MSRCCGTFEDVPTVHGFGDLELDTALFELRRQGAKVPLEPQAFDVLVYLVCNRNRVVAKEELMDNVWGGRFVSETAVTSRIKRYAAPSATTARARRSSGPTTGAATGSSPISRRSSRPASPGHRRGCARLSTPPSS